jgi:hypothetical protein
MIDLIEILPGLSTMLGDSAVAFFPASFMKAIDVVPRPLFE